MEMVRGGVHLLDYIVGGVENMDREIGVYVRYIID
jgi:hypothetical protein